MADEGQLDFLELVQGEEEWLALRAKMGCTASRFGAAFGVGYISRQAYMRRRRGEEEDDRSNPAMEWGNQYEDWVVKLYRDHILKDRSKVILHRHGFRRYPKDPRLGGSPDRICEDLETGEKWVLEIKTTTPSKLRDRPTLTHMCQMQGLMAIYGLSKAHYACWGHDHGLYWCEIDFDPEFWDSHLYPALKEFCDWWDNGDEVPKMKRGEKPSRARRIEQIQVNSKIIF